MKAILLLFVLSACAYGQDRIEPTITLKLEDRQLRQLCEVLIIQAYIASKSSSQFGERQAREIVNRVMGEEVK